MLASADDCTVPHSYGPKRNCCGLSNISAAIPVVIESVAGINLKGFMPGANRFMTMKYNEFAVSLVMEVLCPTHPQLY